MAKPLLVFAAHGRKCRSRANYNSIPTPSPTLPPNLTERSPGKQKTHTWEAARGPPGTSRTPTRQSEGNCLEKGDEKRIDVEGQLKVLTQKAKAGFLRLAKPLVVLTF